MPQLTVRVDGMHCGGCEQRVESGLSRLDGVRNVEADHEAGTASVSLVAGQGDEGTLRETVEDLGFEVAGIETG